MTYGMPSACKADVDPPVVTQLQRVPRAPRGVGDRSLQRGGSSQGTGLVPRYSTDLSSHLPSNETIRGRSGGKSEKSISKNGNTSGAALGRPSSET